jgi:hypothetical protein
VELLWQRTLEESGFLYPGVTPFPAGPACGTARR